MIAIIDYGMGNLRSVQKALEKTGSTAQITQDKETIIKSDKIVLPGVGAMKPAMDKLKSLNLIETIKEVISKNKPFLGICLGFQLLFESSQEGGDSVDGLKIIQGQVKRFTKGKIPHMGWNELIIKKKNCPLFKDISQQSFVYFCHSYYAKPKDLSMATTTTQYSLEFVSSLWQENIFGVQFHPEKSQEIGLTILKNFGKL